MWFETIFSRHERFQVEGKDQKFAPAANRTRGPSMATMDFTTKPLALLWMQNDALSGTNFVVEQWSR
jgi:hypothetical protein